MRLRPMRPSYRSHSSEPIPQFACSIDGVPTTCTLDTGARNALSFYTPFVEAHPSVVPAKLTATGVNGFGVGGGNVGRLGRVQTLSFGGLTLSNLVGDYTTEGGGALRASRSSGANIGGEVLKRFIMTLDYRKLTMTLTPNSAFDLPDHWDRSGVFLINTGAVTIMDVRPATPAARAGLVKGDAIVSVNGSSRSVAARSPRPLQVQAGHRRTSGGQEQRRCNARRHFYARGLRLA